MVDAVHAATCLFGFIFVKLVCSSYCIDASIFQHSIPTQQLLRNGRDILSSFRGG